MVQRDLARLADLGQLPPAREPRSRRSTNSAAAAGNMTRAKDDILQELAREQGELTELERTREEARAKIEALRSELATAITTPPSLRLPTGIQVPQTPADKVRLFRSLFRGRPDIFPTRFVAKTTGRPGYAPACSNKFEPGICALKT